MTIAWVVALGTGALALLAAAVVSRWVLLIVRLTRQIRPIRFIAADLVAPADDPDHGGEVARGEPNPFAAPAVPDPAAEHARDLFSIGFVHHGDYSDAQVAHDVRLGVWTSPDRRTVALARRIRVGNARVADVLLTSLGEDGVARTTMAGPVVERSSRSFEVAEVFHATVERLVAAHHARLAAMDGPPRELDDPVGFLHEIFERRHADLVAQGEERYTDDMRTAVRATARGAWLTFLRSFRVIPPDPEPVAAGTQREPPPFSNLAIFGLMFFVLIPFALSVAKAPVLGRETFINLLVAAVGGPICVVILFRRLIRAARGVRESRR